MCIRDRSTSAVDGEAARAVSISICGVVSGAAKSISLRVIINADSLDVYKRQGKQNASVHHPPTERCQCTIESTGEMLPRKRIRPVSYTHLDVYKRQVHSDCPPLEDVVCKLHSTMWGKSLWIFS